MPFVPWDRAMALGIDEVDRQHQGLLDVLNRLHDNGSDKGVALECLADMGGYADEHFEYEESLMALKGYPYLKSHQAVHQRFREQVAGFERGLEMGTADVQDVLTYLKQWLVSHIMGVDREYARFLGRR